MSTLTTIAGAMLLPDPADWSGKPPLWTLSWDTQDEAALRGNEGRSAMRGLPRAKLAFTIWPMTLQAATVLHQRIRAGLQAGGQFCAPLHGRASFLGATAAPGDTTLTLAPTPWHWVVNAWLLARHADLTWSTHQVTAVTGYALTIAPALPAALDAGGDILPLFFGRMEGGGKDSVWSPDNPEVPIELIGESYDMGDPATVPLCCVTADLADFDFAVIRYQWDPPDGRDLDTRTALVSPAVETDVGWGSSRQTQVPATSSTPFLVWAGDNTTSVGYEAVLVDFARITAAYPGAETITIRMRANWYGEILDGRFNLSFTTYKGGTMSETDHDFVNTGGIEQSSITRMRTITSNVAGDVDGDGVGTLVYTPASRSAMITDP